MAPSPFREELGDVELKVTAGSPLAEVFLIDHAFALVERSIGDLTCTVEPGVYNLKAKLGDAIAERLVVLEIDSHHDLAPDLRIGSAAPIEDSERTREEDLSAASAASRRVASKVGEGAQVFLMARLRTAGAPEAPVSEPVLSLHRPDGTVLAKPSPSPTDPGSFTLGTTVELDPGAYFLRWSDDSGVTTEQAVYAVAGWQTQVFVLADAAESNEIGRTRVSVLMAREGFDPKDDQLRLVEEARTALAYERKVAADFLNDTVPEKLENPMLGLFAAHLMLIGRDAEREAGANRTSEWLHDSRPQAPVRFDQAQFDGIVQALQGLLGAEHPDTVALGTQATNENTHVPKPSSAPPMLWRSWVLLIQASNDAPGLVPVGTWRRVRGLLPLRPFLIWSPADSETDVDASWAEGLALALATAKRRPQEQPGRGGPLSNMLSSATSEASDAPPGGVPANDETRRRVSQQLLAPRAAIDEVASRPSP